ncbi:MAG: 4Fe-4S cluster-binding domain-containing protein, partial [Coriobacteriales bacterium]
MQPREKAAIDPALREWLEVYDGIYRDYLRTLEDEGAELGAPHACAQANRELRERLRSKGALFRNGGASVSCGGISTACEACTGGAGSRTFYFSLKCHRNCYFCFNPNQESYKHYLEHDYDWRADFRSLAREGRVMTHIALTGGEPLLRPAE